MKVYKYHSCENIFLITDYKENIDFSDVAKKLCVDVDGLIAVKYDPFEMCYFNKDGSKALMCGNGIRCTMHYLCASLARKN